MRQLPFTWPISPLFRNCFGREPLLAVRIEKGGSDGQIFERGKSGGGSSKTTFDKIAKAAMSREMLAAGLTAAAAAIAASPKARKAIRDAGLDAADSASQAATQMMTNASKLGSLIAEAVADAAQRVLSGKWADEVGATGAPLRPSRSPSAPRRARRARPARLRPPRRKTARQGQAPGGQDRQRPQAPLERSGAQANTGQAQGAAGQLIRIPVTPAKAGVSCWPRFQLSSMEMTFGRVMRGP